MIQVANAKHSMTHNEHCDMTLLSQWVSEAEKRAGLERGSGLGEVAEREGNEDAMIVGTAVRSIRIKYCMTGTWCIRRRP
jgi:hypothetical protein